MDGDLIGVCGLCDGELRAAMSHNCSGSSVDRVSVSETEGRAFDSRPERQTYFTVVFEGHPRNLPGNPFHIESVWGIPVTIAKGDMLAQIESLCESIEAEK